MILYFQAPPQRPEKKAAVFPLQDLQSPATTKPISCLRTLGNKHIKQVGKGGEATWVEVGWPPAKHFEWYSYPN